MTPPSHLPEQTDPAVAPSEGLAPARKPTGHVPEGAAAEIAWQIGGLARAGLPLPSGLRALGAEVDEAGGVGRLGRIARALRLPETPGRRRQRALRRMLEALADDLEAGIPLEKALDSVGDDFPPHLRGLVLAGSRSGRLADTLTEFLARYRVGDDIRRKVLLGLFYPATLLVGCLATFAILATASANNIIDVLQDFGVNLPALSVAMLQVSRGFAEVGSWIVFGPLLIGLAAWLLSRMLFRPSERRRFLNRLPLVGPLWRWTSLAEFCRALADLTASGLPLAEALPLAARSARDPALEATCVEAARGIEQGRPLADVMDEHHAFPAGVPRFLRWAEGQHSLPDALRLLADILEARGRAHGEFVSTFIVLLSIVVVLWFVALIFVSLVWPMLHLLSALM